MFFFLVLWAASYLVKTASSESLTPGPRPCLQVTLRLDTHPAMITVLEMGAARHFLRMQQLAKTQEERAQLLQPTLEINPRYGCQPLGPSAQGIGMLVSDMPGNPL